MTVTQNGQTVAQMSYAQQLFDLAYPVGIIIETTGSPPVLGTWAAYSAGRVTVGSSTNAGYTVGTTGGEASVTLTTAQMPSHTHGFTPPDPHTGSFGYLSDLYCTAIGIYSKHDAGFSDNGIFTQQVPTSPNSRTQTIAPHTGMSLNNTGSSTAHNNRSLFIVVNMYRRTG